VGESEELKGELRRLRQRIDRMAIEQAEELGALRRELALLERRAEAVDSVEPVEPVEPVKRSPPMPPVAPPASPPPPPPPPVERPARESEMVRPVADGPGVGAAVESPRPVVRGAAELDFGRVWLVRLGVALLVTGLVLLGNYAYRNWVQELPAGVRLAALVLLSGAITGAGWWVARRQSTRAFGEVVIAGGLSFGYWCAYAAHHVERLRVIESPVTGALVLLLAAAVMLAVAVGRRVPAVAVLAILLASYATMLQPLGTLAAFSNLLLAAVAVGLMAWRGWTAPGVAGMAGSYASFGLWQGLGAAGGEATVASLWFLTATWAVFAVPSLPVLAGRIAVRFGERGRAWFAAVNNGAWFALFSWQWWALGLDAYWRVPAGFGALLLALGLWGRDRAAAPAVHVGQGLAALTLALVLRLEGQALTLGLALEAVLLSAAQWRFRRRVELCFALVAVVACAVAAWFGRAEPGLAEPLVMLGLLACGWLLRDACESFRESWADLARGGAVGAVVAGTFVGIAVWCVALPAESGPPVAQGVAVALAVAVWRFGGWLRLPELEGGAIAFAVAAVLLLLVGEVGVATALAVAGLGAAAGFAWERLARVEGSDGSRAAGLAWIQGLLVLLALGIGGWRWDQFGERSLWALAAGLPLATALAGWAGCPRLRAAVSILFVVLLYACLEQPAAIGWVGFVATGSALLTLVAGRVRAPGSELATQLLEAVARSAAVLGWALGWHRLWPAGWGEAMAFGGLGLALVQLVWKGFRALPERLLLLGAAVVWVLSEWLLEVSWRQLDEPAWPSGWGLVVALAGLALIARPLGEAGWRRLPAAGAAVFGVGWATLAFVWHAGWEPVAVLWSGLGFALVGLGLWRRMAVLRQLGFLVLALALGKLFVVDIWDFGTFTRVVAFLALGVALTVLGFVYNRFAEFLRRMMSEEEEEP